MPDESDRWAWKHVTVFGGFDKGSGTKRWKCNHCHLLFNGSYSRVRAHLLAFAGLGVKSCPAVDWRLKQSFLTLEEDRLNRMMMRTDNIIMNKKKKKRKKASEGSEASRNPVMKPFGGDDPPTGLLSSPTRISSATTTLITKEEVDGIIARFVYADGVSISIATSPYFQDLTRALATLGPGEYEPPSTNQLSDTLLSKEKARIEKTITLAKASWPHTGCTILCVNWLDGALRCFCINFFVASPRGVMFLKAIDINQGGDDADAGGDNLFVDVLSETIIQAVPTNVFQVITHLGQASWAFESVILSKFPHIFWSNCTSHSISVLMEEIAELDWMKGAVLCARGIEDCVSGYHRSSNLASSRLIININDPKQCSHPLYSQLSPSYCLVRTIFEKKQALRELVVSDQWKQWKLITVAAEDVISNVEDAILGDHFWSKAKLMLELFQPFQTHLAQLNIEKSFMGDIYDWRVKSLRDHPDTRNSDGSADDHDLRLLVDQVRLLFQTRWDVLFSPLHAAGYILNPKHFGKGQSGDKTVMQGWNTVLERYETDVSGRRVLTEQLSCYFRLEGSLGEDDAVECRDEMDPIAWWENFGSETPELQTLAIKILSQVCTVRACQECRQYSSLPCRESLNKLGVERVEDLTFVQNNLRLQCKRSGNLINNCLSVSKLAGNSRCGSQLPTTTSDMESHP